MSITINYKGANPSDKVQVAGAFNSWTPEDMQLVGESQWQSIFTEGITAGESYQYKFIINGEWGLDPNAESTDDGSGNLNHIATASSVPEQVEPTKATSEEVPMAAEKFTPVVVPVSEPTISKQVAGATDVSESTPIPSVAAPKETELPTEMSKDVPKEIETVSESVAETTAASKAEALISEPKTETKAAMENVIKADEPKSTPATTTATMATTEKYQPAAPAAVAKPVIASAKPEVMSSSPTTPSTTSNSTGATTTVTSSGSASAAPVSPGSGSATTKANINTSTVQRLRTPDKKKKRGFFKRIFG